MKIPLTKLFLRLAFNNKETPILAKKTNKNVIKVSKFTKIVTFGKINSITAPICHNNVKIVGILTPIINTLKFNFIKNHHHENY